MTMKDFVKYLQDTFDERANITFKKMTAGFKEFSGDEYVLTIEMHIDDKESPID